MAQHPDNDDPGLPDFSSSPRTGLPDFEGEETGPRPYSQQSDRNRSTSLAIVLSVAGVSVVVLAVVAIVLSQTLFRGIMHDDTPTEAAPTSGKSQGKTEYIPDPNDPDLNPPPPIFTQAPTTKCSVIPNQTQSPQPKGKVRGGGLEYTAPRGWDFPWSQGDIAYVDDVAGMGRLVENNWYSVVTLGRATFPKDEGGYPGDEKAAVAIFQCYATSAGVIDFFGEKPTVTDYRSEATTIDGHDAWIVQATYTFEKKRLDATNSSIVTSIIVDTPNGPSVVISDAAADVPDHVKGLHEILDSLRVIE